MTKDEILLAQKEYLFPAIFHYFSTPLVIDRAKDQFLWDIDGRKYLDFFAGIVSISVGHSNEAVTRKIHEQVDKLIHCSTVFATEPQLALAKRIADISPGGALRKSFFTNSGTEANETAVVAARCYTGSSEIIALRHSYHGRSAAMMGMTGQATWKMGGVPQPGFVHAHNAYCYRCPMGLTYPKCNVQCARDIEDLIKTATSGRVAAFIGEPIQGVAGFVTPPREYFAVVHEIVKKHGGIFISDEVQTGWGRTGGKWFGIEQWGVQPDMITSAKGLANGMPIGMTTARAEIADAMKGVTISTFGGNPVTTTAAKAVIDFIDEHQLMINAAEVGAYLRARLDELKAKFPAVGDVRGMGLMQAVELVEDPEKKTPSPALTSAIMERCREAGVLIGRGGTYGNCLRITPPLNISRNDVDHAISALSEALAKVTAPVPA
jgi:4-aminobutyrate aminotransferase